MTLDYGSRMDIAKWSSDHWAVFISTSLGFLVWGFVYSLPFLIASWSIVPQGFAPFMFIIASSFLVLGNYGIGALADRIGRKTTFIVTLVLYSSGLAGVILANSLYYLLASLALAELGAGGEEPAALSILAEYSPVRLREKILILSSNFYNVGAFLAALASIYSNGSVYQQKMLFGLACIVLISIMIFARRKMPESIRWLVIKNRYNEAQSIAEKIQVKQSTKVTIKQKTKYDLWLAVVVASILGISQLTTYGLLAFVIGPYYYPVIISQLILIANAGASIAGVLAAFTASVVSRKSYAILSFAGGLVTILVVYFTLGYLSSFLTAFYIALFFNMMFSEYAWAARVLLEPELFRTAIRATYISLIRLSSWIPYIIFVYITSNMSLRSFMLINMLLWGVGFAGAVLWFMRGVETRGKSLEEITGGH